MTHKLELTDAESQLLIELLEQERGDLPSEVRRSRFAATRDDLREREDTVRELLDRLRGAAV